MRHLILSSLLLLFLFSVKGQVSLKHPKICHDKDGFLRCYYDGSYLLKFESGNFKTLVTADSSIKYSDDDKMFTFYSSSFTFPETIDTIHLKLLPHSIIISNDLKQKEITSLDQDLKDLDDFHIGTYSVDYKVSGFVFWAGNKYIKVAVWTWGKAWSWDIVIQESHQVFGISYNSFHKNRVEFVGIQNDSLRYGMSISMTFKSLKKISWLRTEYIDTVTVNGKPVITDLLVGDRYWYYYKKNGKLDSKKTVGEMKLCDCQ
jgi:hypothetical protein